MTTLDQDRQKVAYSITQAADSSGVSEASIRRAIDAGYLIANKPKGNSRVVILREHLLDWLKGE